MHIVKRHGHKEQFDEKKLYASVYSSCLVARSSVDEAENTAKDVLAEFVRWLEGKEVLITSNDIRRQTSKLLEKHNQDAAYNYLHHRVVW